MPIMKIESLDPANVARWAETNGVSLEQAKTAIEAYNRYATEQTTKEYVSTLMQEADNWIEAVDNGDLIDSDIGSRPELIERLRATGRNDLADAVLARVEQEVAQAQQEEAAEELAFMSDGDYIQRARIQAEAQKSWADTQAGLAAMERKAELAQQIIDRAAVLAREKGLDYERLIAHGADALETGRAPDLDHAMQMAEAEVTIDSQSLAQIEAQLDAEIQARHRKVRDAGLTNSQQRAELAAESDDEYRARRLAELGAQHSRDLLEGPLPTPKDVHDAEVAAYANAPIRQEQVVTAAAKAALQKMKTAPKSSQPFDERPHVTQLAEQRDLQRTRTIATDGQEPSEFGGGYREAMARAEAAAVVGVPKTAYGDDAPSQILDPRGSFPEVEPGDAAEQYKRAFRD
jgi:hypothetical protein